MKRCSAKPYEGDKDYIFISYCHKDRALVFPVIERLAYDGYRVWYDEGIDPGSEWPEIIAQHLGGARVCLAFISENSCNSHNCRREISFALLKKKFFVSVMLEEVEMSAGMEMQLSSSQSIYKYKLPTQEEFFDKLYETKMLEECRGTPDHSVVVSRTFEFSDSTFDKKETVFADVRQKEEKFGEAERRRREAEINAEKERIKALREEKARREQDRRYFETTSEESFSSYTVRKSAFHAFKREINGEIVRVNKDDFIIGNSPESDYIIMDNRTAERCRLTINVIANECYVTDNGSDGKTHINGYILDKNEPYQIYNGDVINVERENFIYMTDSGLEASSDEAMAEFSYESKPKMKNFDVSAPNPMMFLTAGLVVILLILFIILIYGFLN